MISEDSSLTAPTEYITYDGRPAALAGEHTFWLTRSIELLPDGHPTKRFVVFMCAFARDVHAGELPGPYTDARAERFAREALMSSREFIAMSHEDDIDLAAHFAVPMREVRARRRDLDAWRTAEE